MHNFKRGNLCSEWHTKKGTIDFNSYIFTKRRRRKQRRPRQEQESRQRVSRRAECFIFLIKGKLLYLSRPVPDSKRPGRLAMRILKTKKTKKTNRCRVALILRRINLQKNMHFQMTNNGNAKKMTDWKSLRDRRAIPSGRRFIWGEGGGCVTPLCEWKKGLEGTWCVPWLERRPCFPIDSSCW